MKYLLSALLPFVFCVSVFANEIEISNKSAYEKALKNAVTISLELLMGYMSPYDGVSTTLENETREQRLKKEIERLNKWHSDIAFCSKVLSDWKEYLNNK